VRNSRTVSLNEALQTVSKIVGKPRKIEQHPMQPGDVEITFACIEKAKSKLDYQPDTSFEQGMSVFISGLRIKN
jgi:UDP-glucuronate 4-epimerase